MSGVVKGDANRVEDTKSSVSIAFLIKFLLQMCPVHEAIVCQNVQSVRIYL